MQDANAGRGKTLVLRERAELNADGVKEIISFDENGASLLTENGELCVEGSGIRISELDSVGKRIRITGKIDALYYCEDSSAKKKSLRSRLFG